MADQKFSTKFIVYGALIASVYIALTMAFAPISFGPIQFRISEALTVLPAVIPSAIPGLFIGCLISNIFGSTLGIIDIVFGSLATLISAYLTYKLRKNRLLVPLPPVIVNALVVSTYLIILIPDISAPQVIINALSFIPKSMIIWFMTVIFIGIGQICACYGIGLPLLYAIEKSKILKKVKY